MHKLLALLTAFASPALAQTPAGVINAPIYATGYISQVGGTNVTTNIPPQPNHPTNLNIYTTGAISGTWTIKLPNPAFEGQMLSFNCGAAVNAISVTSSDGSSIDSTLPTACGINSGFTVQFDQRSNIWRNLGSSNTATFKPFTGVASQWPWQLNADGTWTFKRPDASDISFTPVGTGALLRDAQARLRETISITDFAVCDGVTDDTIAIDRAYAAAAAKPANLFIPSVTCMTQGNTITSTSYASQFSIYGMGRNLSKIRKYGSSTTPVLTIGSASATNFIANVSISGVTFDGVALTTAAALRTYDFVRSTLWDVGVLNSAVGWYGLGGITTSAYLTATGNGVGVKLDQFSSLAGGGYPNNIWLRCTCSSNTTWGVWVDGGNQIFLDGSDIEGNGTTLGAASGGVFVGPNMGTSLADSLMPGVTIHNSWIEANYGIADVQLNSGANAIENTLFWSQATMTTYDVDVIGGRYRITNSRNKFSKTSNINERATASPGNLLDQSPFPNVTYDPTKTEVSNSTVLMLPQAVNGASTINANSGYKVNGAFAADSYLGTLGVSGTATVQSRSNCNGASNALTYAAGSGEGCNSAINAASLGGATFASPGAIGGTTPGAGTFSTLTGQSAINSSVGGSVAGGITFGTGINYVLSANTSDALTINASSAYSLVNVVGPFAMATYTISGLPACSASLLGSGALVSNGTAFGTGTYGSAVSATGAVTRKVICTNTGGPTTYAWAYD